MGIHLPTGTKGIIIDIGIRIQLGKKLLYISKPCGKHKSLVTIVSGAEISVFKKLSHCYLGDLFSVAKYSKLCFSGQHFPSSLQAGFPALHRNLVILQNLLAKPV